MGMHSTRGVRRALGLLVLAACSSDGDGSVASSGPAAETPTVERAPDPPGPPQRDPGASNGGACAGKKDYCSAWNTRKHCTSSAWVDEICQGGCFAGQCMKDACSDECALGEAAGGKT